MQFNKRRSAFTSVIFVALIWLMYPAVIAQSQEQPEMFAKEGKGWSFL